MDAYETDEQQWEAFKKWFQTHGNKLTAVILVVGLSVLGVRYWKHHDLVVRLEASQYYNELMYSQNAKDVLSGEAKAKKLISEYPNTPYAALAGLYLAKNAVDEKAYDKAIEHLQWVVSHGKVEEFQLVARSRAARILIEQKKFDEAFKFLDVKNMDGYGPLLLELKGDVYLAQNKNEEAKVAYVSAMKLLEEKSLENPLLKMKVQELGGSSMNQENLS